MDMSAMAAMMGGAKGAKPSFVVQRAKTGYTKTVAKAVRVKDEMDLDAQGNPKWKTKLTYEEVEVPASEAGYIVSFPMKGHSIRVKDHAELERLGFTGNAGLFIPDADGASMGEQMPDLSVLMQVFASANPQLLQAMSQVMAQQQFAAESAATSEVSSKKASNKEGA